MSSNYLRKILQTLRGPSLNVYRYLPPDHVKNYKNLSLHSYICTFIPWKKYSEITPTKKNQDCHDRYYSIIPTSAQRFGNKKDNIPHNSKLTFMTIAGIFSFFQSKEDEEESELIMTIKRAVLMIQHDEFKGAEQMLHVALRLAQQTQNSDGITYVHDLLANVAFAQGELDKAELLFKDVMQRVLQQGTPEDDLKIIHMSLKLAKIYEQKQDWAKAEQGYEFCMKHLEEQAKDSNDEDVLMLLGMTLDWYARYLHEQNRLDEAFSNYKKAYEMCVRVNGEVHEQTVVLLNDLGTISFLRGDNDNAIQYLTKAVETGRHLPNMEDFSSVYVNLGNIYLQKSMYEEAQKHCKEGYKNAKRHKNEEGLKEATVCLDELRNYIRSDK